MQLYFTHFCRLPVPWLMFSFYHSFAPVPVSSNGLFCAIVLLFLMLIFVTISIAACKWRMNKVLGSIMFVLYFVFLVLSVMLEDRIIVCPVSIWTQLSDLWFSLHLKINPQHIHVEMLVSRDTTSSVLNCNFTYNICFLKRPWNCGNYLWKSWYKITI